LNRKTGIKLLLFFLGILILNLLSRQLLFFFNSSLFQIPFNVYLYFVLTGLRFDLSAIAYANAIFVIFFFLPHPFSVNKIYRKITFFLWLIPNIFIIAINIFDAFYFPFVFRRSTYDLVVLLFSMQSEIRHLWSDLFFGFWPALVIFIIFIFLLIKLYILTISKISMKNTTLKCYLRNVTFLIFALVTSIIAMRGGLQVKPISLVTGAHYASPEHSPLVLNSAFTFIRTFGKAGLETKSFFTEKEEMVLYFNIHKQYKPKDFQKKNIVLIVLEGFSNEHLNSINQGNTIQGGTQFAPFLDSLIHEGYFCYRAFANGKRSVEAIPAILSSVPTLMNTPFILSPYINNSFNSLPQLLQEHDYQSYFFHGGQNGTMNFDSYAYAAGFDKYFGKDEYPDKGDFDGKWGIWDKPFLSFAADELNQFSEPFFATIFTLSSHHPYNVPEQFASMLPDGPLPIHKAIAYADMALRHFFEKISHYSWYLNTLFVITSDHTAEPYLQYYKEPAGMYSIPLLFYDPGSQLKGKHFKVCQQTDILPSILDYLGYNEPFTAFGNSIFDSTNSGFNVTYQSETYQLITDSHIIRFANDVPVKIWKFAGHKLAIEDDDDLLNDSDSIIHFISLYKSYIQQYNNSLIENTIVSKRE
jgi:phosphoglycerol transferase MdoB-like AlkP superfamily enzyme